MKPLLLTIVLPLLLCASMRTQTLSGKVTLSGNTTSGTSGGGSLVANAGPDRSILTNEPLSLDGSASAGWFDGLQADGRHSVQWSFGYGSWTYEGGVVAPIAYPAAGTYTVTLTIYDAGGASSSDTATVTVSDLTLGNETVLSDTGNTTTNQTNLQAAIDGATGTANKVITLPASFVSLPITLKNRTSATHCIIRTAAYASLPNGTSRVSTSDASNMATLQTANNAPIVDTPATSSNPARYYKFLGIHFKKATSTTNYTNSFVLLGQGDETSLSQLPNHLMFDRCYFDGGSTTSDTLRGIFIRGTDISVVNSYLHRFKGVALETQALLFFVGERMAVINNFLEAASENTMSGGGDHSITGVTVSDVVFRRNHAKKDLGWRSGDAAYYGVDMSVKNIFEMKTGNRWSVEGNRFENHWIEDQNYAITITPRNQNGADTWTEIKYLDFSHNKVHKIANVMSIAAEDDLQAVLPTNHILVRHNVFTGVAFYSGQYITFLLGGNQAPPIQGFDKVAIIRSSGDQNGDILSGVGRYIEWGPSTNNTNFTMYGNIAQGFINHDSGVKGDLAMQAACSGSSYSVTKNGFYRSSGTNPTGNTTVALIADVKYVDLAAFDLTLAGDSPFLTAGPAGGRAGADVAAADALTANCVSGAW